MATIEERLSLFNREDNRIIKAIAILCVFVCHLGNQFTRLTTPLGGIGVCMFLIMSGYGLEKSFLSNLTSKNKVGGVHLIAGGQNVLLPYSFHTGL